VEDDDPPPSEGPPPDSRRPGANHDAPAEPLGDLGRYQLLFELARGGMGAVFAARVRGHAGFHKTVAVKRLGIRGGTDEDVAAFLDEARVSAAINHPNVVKTLDLGEQDGVPYLAMEFIEGVSLARLRRRVRKAGETLDPFVVAWIGAQAAAGLHAAHELRRPDGEPHALVHRDVSPENVLLSYDGSVHVADFGVAKFAGAERQTQSGVIRGKFAYMSPEQTEAKALDRRSDLFGLGTVLHECLTGHSLFADPSVAGTICRVMDYRPADPGAGRKDVPADLGPIILRCLEKRPADRFATAAEVAEALRGVLRKAGRVVDPSDVAKLLEAHFPDERARLRNRLRAACQAADRDEGVARAGPVTTPAASPAPEQSSVAAHTTSGPPLQRRTGMWVVLAAVALGATGLWLLQRGPAEDDHGAGDAAVSGSGAATAAVAPEPRTTGSDSSPSGGTVPSDAPAAAESAAPAASSSAAPSSSRPGRLPPTTPPAATNPPAPTPSATPSSHKGVPFQTLD